VTDHVSATERGTHGSYDIVIVGAGVVGAAIARELSHYDLRIALVDAAGDVGEGTSKANTAILHTGFDASPGTLESTLVARGYHLLRNYAQSTGIPVEPVGALLVAWNGEQLDALPALAAKATANGYLKATTISAEELYAREPNVGPGALGALKIPDESIICPWTTTLAFATEAVSGGAELLLCTRVETVHPASHAQAMHEIVTDSGVLNCRYLVNAAGLNSDEVDHAFGHDTFHVTPRRGELIVFDKFARSLLSHILLPVPTSRGKGVLVAPTIYGNVILGPTAEDLDDKADTGLSASGLASLRRDGARILPTLLEEEVTAMYAGLRAATEHGDYQINADALQRYVCVGGIRSTGLTAAMAIAEYVADLLAQIGLSLGVPTASDPPRMPNIGEAFARPYQQAAVIGTDPAYGELVCHCERVTRGEIRDALRSTIPPSNLGGLRRRTRAMMGRCQGFYCGAEVRALLEAEQQPASDPRSPSGGREE
jgi:glycerol-3-phosphate dehydrogenase